jgi:radical SAM superfamily enzyme YgiQ (UPF0313 family)
MDRIKKEDCRVVLCNPPFYRFLDFPLVYQNLGLGYLAGNLLDNGYKHVKIYQFDAPDTVERVKEDFQNYDPEWGTVYYNRLLDKNDPVWDDIKSALKKEMPDILGISTMSPQAESARILSDFAKEINPDIKIIQGGIHASLYPDEVLTKSLVDVVAIGEFDLGMAPLIDILREGESLNDFKGIAYKDNSGKVIKTSPRDPILDLDTIPYPLREISTTTGDKPTIPAVMPMVTSRGCPFNCTFCARLSLWGRSVRYRSAENVVNEIEELYNKHGARVFIFEDDTFTLNKPRLLEFCRLVKERKLDISWECQTKVNVVEEDTIKLLKGHGCTTISIGAESGNQEILNSLNKKQTIEQIKTASKIIQDNGIILRPFFMIGYPNETEESLDDTFTLIKELDSYTAHVYPIIPMPGSKIYEEVKSKGNISEERWFFYFFWNVNIYKRDFLSSKYVYDKFIEIRNYIDRRRRTRLKFLSRNPKYILRKIFENFHSPKQLWYLAKRFVKIQIGR